MPESKSLYTRLGGYDAIAAVSENLVGRLMADQRLGRFWAHRSEDGLKRELQLLINFLCNVTGGPMVYTGRDMKTSHKGMRIDEQDWKAFVGHVNATLDNLVSPERTGKPSSASSKVRKATSSKPSVQRSN